MSASEPIAVQSALRTSLPRDATIAHSLVVAVALAGVLVATSTSSVKKASSAGTPPIAHVAVAPGPSGPGVRDPITHRLLPVAAAPVADSVSDIGGYWRRER